MDEEKNISQGDVITPLMVRDAIIECFNKAHCLDAGLSIENEKLNEDYCKSVVEKAFKDVNGNFNEPTRKSIMRVLDNLAEFSKNFRNKEVIEKHYDEIMQMVNNY